MDGWWNNHLRIAVFTQEELGHFVFILFCHSGALNFSELQLVVYLGILFLVHTVAILCYTMTTVPTFNSSIKCVGTPSVIHDGTHVATQLPGHKFIGSHHNYGMPKWYLFNSQNIMQLSKNRSTFFNISCNSQNNMQLRKGVYLLGTCIMNSEKLWVLWPGHALVVGKVAG